MKRIIIGLIMIFAVAMIAMAVPSDKPNSHDASWIQRHGQASKLNMDECLQCHTDRVACIKCHEEVAPRSHTPGWVKKGHGLEARWDRAKCAACHKEDSCIECHTQTPPASHRPGWRAPLNRHCGNCHYPIQETTCFTCHKSAHAPNEYSN